MLVTPLRRLVPLLDRLGPASAATASVRVSCGHRCHGAFEKRLEFIRRPFVNGQHGGLTDRSTVGVKVVPAYQYRYQYPGQYRYRCRHQYSPHRTFFDKIKSLFTSKDSNQHNANGSIKPTILTAEEAADLKKKKVVEESIENADKAIEAALPGGIFGYLVKKLAKKVATQVITVVNEESEAMGKHIKDLVEQGNRMLASDRRVRQRLGKNPEIVDLDTMAGVSVDGNGGKGGNQKVVKRSIHLSINAIEGSVGSGKGDLVAHVITDTDTSTGKLLQRLEIEFFKVYVDDDVIDVYLGPGYDQVIDVEAKDGEASFPPLLEGKSSDSSVDTSTSKRSRLSSHPRGRKPSR